MVDVLYSGKSIYECPKCHQYNNKVDDSRDNTNMNIRVRRRRCDACGYRWHTAEICVEDVEELEARRIKDPQNQYKGVTNYLDTLLDEETDVLRELQGLKKKIQEVRTKLV